TWSRTGAGRDRTVLPMSPRWTGSWGSTVRADSASGRNRNSAGAASRRRRRSATWVRHRANRGAGRSCAGPPVDEGEDLAADIGNILDVAAALILRPRRLAAKAAHGLELVCPALHVA